MAGGRAAVAMPAVPADILDSLRTAQALPQWREPLYRQ